MSERFHLQRIEWPRVNLAFELRRSLGCRLEVSSVDPLLFRPFTTPSSRSQEYVGCISHTALDGEAKGSHGGLIVSRLGVSFSSSQTLLGPLKDYMRTGMGIHDLRVRVEGSASATQLRL